MSGLSGEDRKRLRGLANQPSVNNAQARAIHSALTLIDQQEKALEAADELAGEWERYANKSNLVGEGDEIQRVRDAESRVFRYCVEQLDLALYQGRAYRSARATSTKEDG